MKTIQACTHCGSGNVMRDAWVAVNDPDDVRTFDDLYCLNCESSCQTNTVEVADDFDPETDLYKEST